VLLLASFLCFIHLGFHHLVYRVRVGAQFMLYGCKVLILAVILSVALEFGMCFTFLKKV
jgi:hypothetical protein